MNLKKILVPGIESFDYIKRDSQTSDIENYHREQKNLENIHKEPSDVEKEVIHGNRMEKTKKKVIKDLNSKKDHNNLNLNTEIEMELVETKKKISKKGSSKKILNEYELLPTDNTEELEEKKEKKIKN